MEQQNINISVFLNEIKKEAKRQQNEIKKETESYIKTQLESAEKEAEKETENYKKAAVLKIKNEQAKELSEISQSFKNAAILKREKHISELKAKLLLKLNDFLKTDEYTEFLKKSLKEILKKDKNAVIYVKEKDLENKVFAEFENLNIKKDKTISVGGIKAEVNNGSLVYDDTLDSRILTAMQSIYEKEELIIDF